jgi:hypothetical protein
VMPGSNFSVVADANDLKPRMVRVFRYTCGLLPSHWPQGHRQGRGGRPPSPARYRDQPHTPRIRGANAPDMWCVDQ